VFFKKTLISDCTKNLDNIDRDKIELLPLNNKILQEVKARNAPLAEVNARPVLKTNPDGDLKRSRFMCND